MLAELAEFVLLALLCLFMVTQVIWPALMGRPLFPFFRKDKREVEKELEQAKDLADNEKVRRTTDHVLEGASKKNNRRR